MLLRLQLVAHPGQGGIGLQGMVFGQEVRVVPARAVDGGERAHDHPLHSRGRRRGQALRRGGIRGQVGDDQPPGPGLRGVLAGLLAAQVQAGG